MSLDARVALLSLLAALALVNWSIFNKEQHLAHGQVVYLELAPVDPRSLMQGDYMALRFELAQSVRKALPKTAPDQSRPWRQSVEAADGHVVVALDERNVATYRDLYTEQSLGKDQILLRYRVRHGQVKFATNAFYFQEGHAGVYQPARYGRFRVDAHGELLLVGLNDAQLAPLSAAGD